MAAKEINSSTSMQTENYGISKTTTLSKQYLDTAYDQLLFKNFNACIRTCENGIIRAKLEFNGNPDIVEALCVVGIQAFAELNYWQKVLPFVQNVYNSIEDCPFRVVQLCILLHAKVGEYSQCYVIASVWLKAAKNFQNLNYVTLIEIYIVNILLPRGERHLIDSFLDACPGLSSMQCKRLNTDYVEKTTQIGTLAKNIDTSRLTREVMQKQQPTVVKDTWLLKVIKKVKFALFGNAPVYSYSLVKVTMVAVCLYLISISHQKGFLTSNFSKVGVIFEGMVKVLKSMFAPNSYIMR